MITVTDIHNLLKTLVEGGDLDTFALKFAEMSYDIEHTDDKQLIQLCYDIESVLAQGTAGLASEAEIRKYLESKAPANEYAGTSSAVFEQAAGQIVFLTWTLTEPINLTAAGAGMGQPFGTSPLMGFSSGFPLQPAHQTSTGLPR